jgi:hypothetical protein
MSPNAKSCPNCGITTKKKVGPLGFYILIGVAVFVIFSIVGKFTADAPNAFAPVTAFAQATKLADEPLEYILASLDAGRRVRNDDITVARFRSLLQQLSDKYVENQQQVADMTVNAKNILKKAGVAESLLNIMEGMNQLFYSKAKNMQYAEYAAAYCTLREKGQSHSDAIAGLREILRALGVY